MAAFDANLMLRSTTTTLFSTGGVALAGTGSFIDLGTGGAPVDGLTIRADGNTADANASTLIIRYDFSDDASTVQESITLPAITGTEARATGWERLTRFAFKRRYVRSVFTLAGAAAGFGVVTVGIDAGEYAQLR